MLKSDHISACPNFSTGFIARIQYENICDNKASKSQNLNMLDMIKY